MSDNMKKLNLSSALAVAAIALAACTNGQQTQEPQGLVIEKQGIFASGGHITDAIPGDYDPTQNWMDPERKGTTNHVDHANTFYQIPAGEQGMPMVFLHGYGQTRTGWQATPDGREGWADLFLKKGHPVFLVDQPRRGEAGATENIVTDPGDVAMCPPGVRHWHGAAPNSRFAHLAANTNPNKPGVEWFDMLSKEEYDKIEPVKK